MTSDDDLDDLDDLDGFVRELVPLMARLMRLTRGGYDMLPADVQQLFDRDALGARHVPVLVAVAVHGPWSVGEIARHVALNPATTSQLINELSRAGLLRREPDPHDRRRMIVSVAQKHREAIHKIASVRMSVLREALGQLTPVERQLFLHGWRTFLDAAERRIGT